MSGVTLAALAACGSDNTTSPPTLTTIVVSPSNPSIAAGSTQQFTAVGMDQNGNVIPISPTWGVSGGGGISGDGLFTAGSTTGTFNNAVTATSGNVTGSTSVTVTAAAPAQVGTYVLQTVDGKAPPDTVVQLDTLTVVFLDGSLALNADLTYKLLFHSTTSTHGGPAVADSSGSTGTYTVSGNSVVIHNSQTQGTVTAALSLPTLSFTDDEQLFVFHKSP